MQAHPFDGALVRGRTSLAVRLERWRAKRWAIAQCAAAAGVAWWQVGTEHTDRNADRHLRDAAEALAVRRTQRHDRRGREEGGGMVEDVGAARCLTRNGDDATTSSPSSVASRSSRING